MPPVEMHVDYGDGSGSAMWSRENTQVRAYLRLLALKSPLLFSDVENFDGLKTRTENKKFCDSVKNVPIYIPYFPAYKALLIEHYVDKF